MAGDINPPVGRSGGEKLARDAKAALAREEAALKDAGKAVTGVEGTAAETQALRKRLSAAQRKALAPQYAEPIGPDKARFLREAKSRTAALHRAAVDENQRAQELARQRDGQLKAARTKLRKLNDTPSWMTPTAGDRESHLRRTELAEAAVPRAEERAKSARAAAKRAADRATETAVAARDARVRANAARDALADPEAARTKAAEEGRKARGRTRKAEGEDIKKALGDSAKDVAAAAKRNEADVLAAQQRAAEHARRVATGLAAPVGSPEAKAAVARERAAEAERQRAAQAPSRALVPRTPANAGGPLTGAQFGQYPYAPIGREQNVSDTGPDAAEAKRRAEYVANAQRVGRESSKADARRTMTAVRENARQLERAAKEEAKSLGASTAAIDENEAAKARLEGMDRRVAAAQAGSSAGFNRAAVAAGLSTQALTRHGYLTSEAIEAAKRGELTYKQWGQQISGTAAKFAGWTAVSIPVFAALDGVRRIGQGAIASASGVGKLQRVIDDVDGSRLQAQFRGLSGQFNVPIDEVSEAVGRMGQVFKTQEGAVQGATAALYAFKTGGVDVEVGSKNLIAIANGFKLAGAEILPFFDQINEAQNEFGVTIPDSLAGLAKAAGAFGNAGGSKDYLLSLISTGKLTTGRTGENIGTAVQRSVGFLSRPKNQEALRGFGIDPTQGIEQVYTQAFKVAEKLSGKELQRLATALSSPQYASYFVPILQNYQKFKDIQKGTSAKASEDSAAKELAVIMGQLDERIKSIGIELGKLGSNLAQGGFLDGLKVMVFTFDKALSLVNKLLGVFNILPGPIKTAVAAALQLKGLQLLARRVPGLGEAVGRGPLAGLAPYLRPTEDQSSARGIRKGLNTSLQERRNELERLNKDQLRAESEHQLSQGVYRQTREETARRVSAGEITPDEALRTNAAAADAVDADDRRRVRATLRAREAHALTVKAEQELTASVDAEAAAIAARGRGAGAAAIVAQNNAREGFYASSTDGAPSTGPVLRGTQGGDRVLERATLQQGVARGRIGGYVDGLKRYSTGTRALSATVRGGIGIAAGAGRAATSAAGALVRGAATIGAALGPIDAALIGLLVFYEAFKSSAEAAEKQKARLRAAAYDPGALRRLAKSGDVNAFGAVQAQIDAFILEQQRLRGSHLRIPQIRQELSQRLAASGGVKAQTEATENALAQARDSYIANLPKTRANRPAKAALAAYINVLEAQLRDLRATGGQLNEAIADLNSPEDFQKLSESVSSRIGLRGRVGATDPAKAAKQRIRATTLLADGTFTPAQTLQAINDAEASVLEPAKKQLEDMLAVARTPAQVRAAHAQYARTARGVQGGGLIRGALGLAQRKVLTLQRDLATAEPLPTAQTGVPDGLGILGKERKRGQSIQSIRQSIAFQNGLIRNLLRLLGVSTSNIKLIDQEEDQGNYDTHAERFDQNTQLLISRQTTPEGKRQVGTSRARQKLARVNAGIKKGLDNVGNRVNAQIDLNNSLQADAEQAAADAEAHFEAQLGVASAKLAASGASDLTISQDAVAKAQQIYQHVARLKGADSTEALTALENVYRSKEALNNLVKQQAKALYDSVFTLRESKTDNPIKIDRLEYRHAKGVLRRAGFDTPAERNEAEANVHRSKRQLENDIRGRKIENIEFDAQIGKITVQQEIAALQRLLHTTKKGSEARRDLKRKILGLKHDLAQDSGLDLNVGSIQLPTAYAIRRFVKAERQGVNVTQSYATTIHISRDVDLGKVGDHYDRIHKGAVASAARAGGFQ